MCYYTYMVWIYVILGILAYIAFLKHSAKAAVAITIGASILWVIDGCWMGVTGKPSFVIDPERAAQVDRENARLNAERARRREATKAAAALPPGVTKELHLRDYTTWDAGLRWARIQREEHLFAIAEVEPSITEERVECCLKAVKDYRRSGNRAIGFVYDCGWGAAYCTDLKTADITFWFKKD